MLADAEPYLGVRKHRRLYVEAPAAYPVATGDEGGAAVDAGLDVPQDLVELLAVDLTTQRKEKISGPGRLKLKRTHPAATLRNRSAYLRPLFDTAPEGVADHALQGAGLGLLHELVVHALVHERPRPGAAALALCGWESVPELRIGSNDCSNTDTARLQTCSWTRTWLKKTAWCASSTAWSTSASSMTTKGDLPPSSRVTGFRLLLAASSSTICPVPVDPVNASCTKNVQDVQGSDQRRPLKHSERLN